MDLKSLSAQFKADLNKELQAVLKGDQHPPVDQLHGMMQYHMGWLDKEMQPEIASAGKQIRPILLLLTCMGAGGDWCHALPAAAAIELIHNFSLIHDDIEDRSDTRRGRETVWSIWGVPLGINTGDAMFAAAHLALNRLTLHNVPAETIVTAYRRFDEVCIQLTQGQDADMRFEERQSVEVGEYLEMITGKTSVLVGLCAELGGLIAGRPASELANFWEFGLNLGLAFQMLDDILGIWGDEAAIGKSATSDLVTRKKTLPVLYGLEQVPELHSLYFDADVDLTPHIPQIVNHLTDCGAREFTQQKAEAYTQLAMQNFEQMNVEGDAAVALNELANVLLMRQT